MPKVVVIGAGGAGCGAAIAAAKAGADAVLLERTDMVFGGAVWAGRMDYNGKFVSSEECKALGGGEIFAALESIILHHANIVDEEFGYVYNCPQSEAVVRKAVIASGVKILFEARAVDVIKEGDSIIKKVILADGSEIEGDAFVDATGSAGGLANCIKYGGACVMCPYYRCPVFGDRVGIATKAGAKSYTVYRPDGSPGTLTAAVGIHKESLSPELLAELEEKGAVTIPLPPELIDYGRLKRLGAVRSRAQMENLNLVDNGVAKCVGSGNFPLHDLRKIRGFEKAQLAYPLGGGGGKADKISDIDVNTREDTLRIPGFKNLFGAGTKVGTGGVSAVVCEGYLAGHNATRAAAGKELLELPTTIALGDFTKFIGNIWRETNAIPKGYAFSHGPALERLKKLGFYTGNAAEIHKRVENAGLKGIYDQKIV